ncbi:hypothetical protein GGU10DRAFT_387416 [Lentinula aff. detonsa]|uniref:Uncharacterized protein n=1 Tax=Lentinula aff. detonsa TaxID=2804958 RepID=A0AA38KGA2_9AGAR|nr:hypothetical protein GGU10DRAFT_387416 [Lentinula aff. detonsa]
MQILSIYIYLGFILGLFATVQAAPFGSEPGFENLSQRSRDDEPPAQPAQAGLVTQQTGHSHVIVHFTSFALDPHRAGTNVPAEVSHRLANYFHEHESDILLDDPVNQIGYLPGTMWPAGRSNRVAVDFVWARSLDSPFTHGHLEAE